MIRPTTSPQPYNRAIVENNMRYGNTSSAQDVGEHWLRNHDVHYVDTTPVRGYIDSYQPSVVINERDDYDRAESHRNSL